MLWGSQIPSGRCGENNDASKISCEYSVYIMWEMRKYYISQGGREYRIYNKNEG
jgi:hypothetical protein